MALSHVTSSPPLLSLGWALIKFVCIFRSANESRRSKARPCAPLPPCTAAKTLGVLYWGRQEGGVDELKRLIKLRFSELRAAEEKRPILAAQISNSKGHRMRFKDVRVKQSEQRGSSCRRVESQLPNQKPPCCHKTQNTCYSGQFDFIFASPTVYLISCCPDSLNQLRCQRSVFFMPCPAGATKLLPPPCDF